jgi:S1/P1 Nuclease
MQLSRVILMLGIVNVTGAPVAWGWGADGHQLVGAVADALIAGSPAASKVNSILGTETLQQASLWADCVKGTNEKKAPFKFTVDTKKFPECKPFENATGVAAMVDYVNAITMDARRARIRRPVTSSIIIRMWPYSAAPTTRTTRARAIMTLWLPSGLRLWC